ncbi:Upstream activation factor subunit spp27 [Ceratobasidium sp. AG-Ba]|nr:Upstream activation factor subunit spp27 [Ceratobasidium sp. AG-Ba]QRW13020.1 Upstream activation factor subunit spp27 [Ceratobasidium sp. AG-Ba]
MPDVASLEPKIYAILTAPAVDLDSISAKRVRAQLRANDPELGDDWVRANKEEIDKLTAAVFERVRAEENAQESRSPSSPPASSPPPAKSAPTSKGTTTKKKTAEEEADAEYARRLASELNGHKTRAGSAGATTKKKAATGKRKAKKSAEEIEESDEDGEGGGAPAKKAKKKRKTMTNANDEDGSTKKRGGGFQKEYALSPAMAEFTGTQALSRPQIVKKMWDHIKANNLQNPQDKREILCDDAMQRVFGVNKINMFQMNKLISNHVFEPQESA